MLSRIVRAFHWARALAAEEPKIALVHLAKMETIRPLQQFERALKITWLIGADRFDEADRLMDAVASETNDAERSTDIYVNLYVRRMRAAIEGNAILVSHLERQARIVNVKRAFRRWLPMGQKD